jgi:hypothetical protein
LGYFTTENLARDLPGGRSGIRFESALHLFRFRHEFLFFCLKPTRNFDLSFCNLAFSFPRDCESLCLQKRITLGTRLAQSSFVLVKFFGDSRVNSLGLG